MATIKKFKLNPVVEPFTEEDLAQGEPTYYSSAAFSWTTYMDTTEVNGVSVPADVWLCVGRDEYFKEYIYVFEHGFDYAGVPNSEGVGWYELNNSVFTKVDTDNFVISLRMDTEKPDDWPETDIWDGPFITDYFYKLLTEVSDDEPSEPSKPLETYYRIKRSTLVDIANAIREKTGKTDLIKVSDLDDAVKELSGSGPVVLDLDVDADPSTLDTNINTIIRVYEEVETSEVLRTVKSPVPVGNQDHIVSDLKFDTNVSDEDVIKLFEAVFPGLAEHNLVLQYSQTDHYLFYNSSSDFVSMNIRSDVTLDGTEVWRLAITVTRGSGLVSNPMWECYISKNDYSVVSGGKSWATEVEYSDREKMSIGNGVITIHFGIYGDTYANSNDPDNTGASGTFSELLFPTIYVEQVEYVKERQYVNIATFDKDGNMIVWSKQE